MNKNTCTCTRTLYDSRCSTRAVCQEKISVIKTSVCAFLNGIISHELHNVSTTFPALQISIISVGLRVAVPAK